MPKPPRRQPCLLGPRARASAPLHTIDDICSHSFTGAHEGVDTICACARHYCGCWLRDWLCMFPPQCPLRKPGLADIRIDLADLSLQRRYRRAVAVVQKLRKAHIREIVVVVVVAIVQRLRKAYILEITFSVDFLGACTYQRATNELCLFGARGSEGVSQMIHIICIALSQYNRRTRRCKWSEPIFL